jgi:hypothetical protein
MELDSAYQRFKEQMLTLRNNGQAELAREAEERVLASLTTETDLKAFWKSRYFELKDKLKEALGEINKEHSLELFHEKSEVYRVYNSLNKIIKLCQ